MKKVITYTITINNAMHTVEARRNGCTVPIFTARDVAPNTMAEAWRSVASAALEEAHYQQHREEFNPPLYDSTARQYQFNQLKDEHKSIFEGEETA